MRALLVPLCLAACSPDPPATLAGWSIQVDGTRLHLSHDGGATFADVGLSLGTGSVSITAGLGNAKIEDLTVDLTEARFEEVSRSEGLLVLDAFDPDGLSLGTVRFEDDGDLRVRVEAGGGSDGRVRWTAACDSDEHFMGLGSHAMDVDHVGQAFPLWVTEPGIGKSDSEESSSSWPIGGTRHASSYPVPFLLRPHHPSGLLVSGGAGVDVDLCASSDRWAVTVWEGDADLRLFTGSTPLSVVQALNQHTGRPRLSPRWAFTPWNDAIRGEARVREVAATLRAAGASASVIWTEDWKGAQENATGYRLGEEWFTDTGLYPDLPRLDADLEAMGFKFFGYFAPFVGDDTVTSASAEDADVLLQHPDGGTYWFTSPALRPVSMPDLTHPAAREWSKAWMVAALELGIDGWMADFAEWLPTDAVLADGDPMLEHNLYPGQWQRVTGSAQEGREATFFCRSGWSDTSGSCPIVWAGDQRTSFDADDGLPSVLSLGLGLAASGVPIFTHDVAGYQSVGNPPSDKELWFRWASLGAFSPVMRTHHGSFDTQNWQFDRDEETLQHWVDVTAEHMRLWPYRYALASRAANDGTPMILPVAFVFDDAPWDRADAWMLGDAMLVAPVLTAGATSRQVDLPDDVSWYAWSTHAPAVSGSMAAPVDTIPVFVASGHTIPTFDTVPHTLAEPTDGSIGFAEADAQRVVYLFGGGGPFEEADGTSYRPSGTASGAAEATDTLASGDIVVGGVTLSITGTTERRYRVVVVP